MTDHGMDINSIHDDSFLDDHQYHQILATYRRQQFIESITGPAISMASHIVLLTLVAAFLITRPEKTKEPDLQAQVVEIPLPKIEPLPPEIEELDKQEPEEDTKIVSTVEAPNLDPGEQKSPENVDDNVPTTADNQPTETVLTTVPTNSVLVFSDPNLGGRTPGGRSGAISRVGHGPYTSRGQSAVLRALRWLKRVQNPNGSWGTGTQWNETAGHPAHTGLALLTFLAHGETPLSEEFGATVQKAMQWLTSYANQSDLATIIKKRHGAYTHGIATYALCEAYAMTKIPFLQTAMETCLYHVIEGQMPNGGFGYGYTSGPRWDMSVAGWNIQALKAGRMAGSHNPELSTAIEKSIRFCRSEAYAGNGGFGYAAGKDGGKGGGRPNMGGVGVVALQLLGHSESAQAVDGVARIAEKRYPEYKSVETDPSKWNEVAGNSLYGWYYDTQAMYNTYKLDKKRWKTWQRTFEKVLVTSQNDEGYWETSGKHQIGTADTPGRVLSTCLSTLQLEVYYRYLSTVGSHVTQPVAEDTLNLTSDDGGMVIDILD